MFLTILSKLCSSNTPAIEILMSACHWPMSKKVWANCYRSEEMTVASLKLVISHKVAIFHHFANDQK